MLKVGLRGVFARKLRAFLTALAVFLGVALMTGTYVLTDTFTNSFGQIFEESSEGIDVAVVPREAVESEGGAEPPGYARATARARSTRWRASPRRTAASSRAASR